MENRSERHQSRNKNYMQTNENENTRIQNLQDTDKDPDNLPKLNKPLRSESASGLPALILFLPHRGPSK